MTSRTDIGVVLRHDNTGVGDIIRRVIMSGDIRRLPERLPATIRDDCI